MVMNVGIKNIIPSASGRDGFLRTVHGVTFRDKVCSCEIRRVLNDELLLLLKRCYLRWFGHVTRMSEEWLGGNSCWLHSPAREIDPEVVQGPDEMHTSPTLLGPILVWSQQKNLRLPNTAVFFQSSQGYWPRGPPWRQSGRENEKINEKRSPVNFARWRVEGRRQIVKRPLLVLLDL